MAPSQGRDCANRPHLFLTADKVVGLRCLAELRDAIERPGHSSRLWQRLLAQAKRDRELPAVTPANFQSPAATHSQVAGANPDFWVCRAAGQRILRNALACLVTGETHYRDTAWHQIDALLDRSRWPDWRDRAHRQYPADLRTGSLGRDIAIAFDWLYRSLTPAQRRRIVQGLDARVIQPFWKSVDSDVWWVNGKNNWTTCIVGGLGIVGMALAGEHPDAGRLVEFAEPRMNSYLEQYGEAGEFNESVGYSTATRLPVVYYWARMYARRGTANPLAQGPLVRTALWNAYTYLPPGRMMAFGDASVDRTPNLDYFAAVASASRNQMLQWFYVQMCNAGVNVTEELPLPLLAYDESLKPTEPTGQLELGRAFREHGAILVSRSSWDLDATPCVVYGKAGIEHNHEHHDAGQLCIDGYGQRLIVDLGSPSGYPADFFGPNRWQYYNASWIGHNIVTVDGEEMNAGRGDCAQILATEFDDRRGGYWQLDLTGFVPSAQRAVRTVVHLTPGVVAVVDDVALTDGARMQLRWHTVDQSTPSSDGGFVVQAEGVKLAGRIVSLDGQELDIRRNEHTYRRPFDSDRTGAKLQQRHESFLQVRPEKPTARLLTLFAVLPPDAPLAAWQTADATHRIDIPAGPVVVQVDDGMLVVTSNNSGHQWRVPLR